MKGWVDVLRCCSILRQKNCRIDGVQFWWAFCHSSDGMIMQGIKSTLELPTSSYWCLKSAALQYLLTYNSMTNYGWSFAQNIAYFQEVFSYLCGISLLLDLMFDLTWLCCLVFICDQSHASAWPFLKPVDKAEAPGYYNYIKYPIGLSKSLFIFFTLLC